MMEQVSTILHFCSAPHAAPHFWVQSLPTGSALQSSSRYAFISPLTLRVSGRLLLFQLKLVETQPRQQTLSCDILNNQSDAKTDHRSSTIEAFGVVVEAKLWLFQLGSSGGLQLCHYFQYLAMNSSQI
jgi:hypothetical protein